MFNVFIYLKEVIYLTQDCTCAPLHEVKGLDYTVKFNEHLIFRYIIRSLNIYFNEYLSSKLQMKDIHISK